MKRPAATACSELPITRRYHSGTKRVLKKLFFVALLFILAAPVHAISGMDGGPSKTITPARIVSLAPSVTETLFALGLEDNIAGVSDVCDYPAEAKEIPKVGGMKNPSLESIVRLRPDIVIMTKDGNSGETKEKLDSLGIEVFAFSARTITEYTDELLRLGERLDVGEKAKEIAAELNSELNKIKAR
ncbi:MAG: ABC transporter substrate-binding protein, partial [Deltaproteobacteria bacterium]|nr:ABC transporter substrate-binding protein [Deltaproteobacteria bacterium]